MIRVLIADDHSMVRVGLRQVLTELGGFEVVGEAEDGRGVLNSEALSSCDVLVLDLSLPVVSGSEVLKRLRETHPWIPIVVHSMHPPGQFARRSLQAGAVAYVPKDSPPQDLVDAVQRAAEHGVAERPDLPAPESMPHETLTRREHQVFMLILEGRQVVDIAAELDVHSCTVSNHLTKVRKKLGARTVADVVRYAFSAGFVSSPGIE